MLLYFKLFDTLYGIIEDCVRKLDVDQLSSLADCLDAKSLDATAKNKVNNIYVLH